ncbi:MAG: hypothetical protein GXP08_15705 [Gammaproteobacteria bacterium]|nr:hypothetical protein [Gammaproteobacteria bacterium]
MRPGTHCSAFVLIVSLGIVSELQASCTEALWPTMDYFGLTHGELPPMFTILKKQANKALTYSPNPVKTLTSAGIANKQAPALMASRRAFKDADSAMTTALAYRVFRQRKYLNHSTNILIRWAMTNQPTGHPIDENRLEGLIWAYDAICRFLSESERATIIYYFKRFKDAKLKWVFGPKSRVNNHKTHHLKLLILLDSVLGDRQALAQHIIAATHHSKRNININTGESIDYIERDALYYHVYDLEAWLEIQLITQCCAKAVESAFRFAQNKILSADLEGEFENSSSDFDRRREQAGFDYSKAGSRFDRARFARSIVTRYTGSGDEPNEILWSLATTAPVLRKLIAFHVRRFIWPLA